MKNKSQAGNVRALPRPDDLPPFLRRVKALAPPFLFPNDPKSLERAMEEWEKLDGADESYVQTFCLAQLVLGIGELVHEQRVANDLARRSLGLHREVASGLQAMMEGDADADDDDDGDADAGDDDGDGNTGSYGDEAEGGDDQANDGGDAAPDNDDGDAHDGGGGDTSGDEPPLVEAEVIEEPPAATPPARPRRNRKAGGS